MRFTKRSVEALPLPTAGERFEWDEELSGFDSTRAAGACTSCSIACVVERGGWSSERTAS